MEEKVKVNVAVEDKVDAEVIQYRRCNAGGRQK